MKNIILVLFFLLCTIHISHAQTFRGGLTAGINFTQIDGDAIGGYTKIGMSIGAISEIVLSKNWNVGLELLYSQQGSASSSVLTSYGGTPFKIKFDYAAIPILIKYHDPKGGLIFGGGFSVNRLVNYTISFDRIDQTDNFFVVAPKSWELGLIGNIGYLFTPVWGLDLRLQYSLTAAHNDCATSLMRNCAWFNNLFTLRTIFMFSALKKKGVE